MVSMQLDEDTPSIGSDAGHVVNDVCHAGACDQAHTIIAS